MSLLGVRGSNDFVADQRPKNWRNQLLRVYPDGEMPLTGLTSLMKSEATDDPEFYWWTKALPVQGGAITTTYTDSLLSSAYTSGGVAGTVLYCKVPLATAEHFRSGHQVLLRDESDLTVDCVGKCLDVLKNGATSVITVRLLEDDDNSSAGDISDADRILVIGSINAEMGAMPSAIAYDPTKFYNLTQIFRTPLEISRTARRTNLRTGEAYKEAKREALELHGIEMEKAFLWGIKTENVGDNGKPERTTLGLINFIRQNTANGAIVTDFAAETNVAFQNKYFVDAGEEWLDYYLEQIFRHGGSDRDAFCGSGVILALNKIIKAKGNYQIDDTTTTFGMAVTKFKTPFGQINFKRHPLFSFEATDRNTLVIFDGSDLRYRHITDTTFYGEGEKQNTGKTRYDGTAEEWLTEAGLEHHHPQKCALMTGFGATNGSPS
jgi:hypothetical protein